MKLAKPPPRSANRHIGGQFGYAGSWGYQEDKDSGLKLLGHRYYDPSTGRFLTRDPVKDGKNWYGYCENGPTVEVDPAGLSFWGWADDQWVAVSAWWCGTDTTDPNGNPVRIGGWPGWFNHSGNAITINGTIHLKSEGDWQMYKVKPWWQDHEEGHIAQNMNFWKLPSYAACAAVAYFNEKLGISPPTQGSNPSGHDSNPWEMDADLYALEKEGI